MPKNMKNPPLRFKGFTDDWEQCEFKEIFNYERPDEYIVSSEEYSDTYSTPVLTANKGFILGYTNETRIYEKPCVIFDDFTLDSKFVDFSFMVKSSAMKILTTKEDFDLRFAHELLNSSKIENLGHARHYISVVQPTLAKVPKHPEQTKISALFENLDSLITLHQRKFEKLINIKKSLLEKMFPAGNEKVPKIRFKGFTDDWEQRDLLQVARYRNGKAHENEIDELGQYIVVNSKFVSTDGEIKKFTNNMIEPLYENELAFVLSDVPNGKAIARTFLIKDNDKYSLNQRIAGITPNESTHPYFLSILMNRNKYFLSFDDGAKQTNLSKSDVEKFESLYPVFQEQSKIGTLFENLDSLITLHQRKHKMLINLKKALLERMFV